MTIINLPEGTHTIKWTLSGYNDLTAQIKISSTGQVTCISVSNGSCGGYSIPRVHISGSTVTGYMKSSASTPTPTPTPTIYPTPTQTPTYSYIEKFAEAYPELNPPMIKVYDPSPNGNYYIDTPKSAGDDSDGFVKYSITIPKAGNYKIVALTLGENINHNSFYLSWDYGTKIIFDFIPSTNFKWANVSSRGSGEYLYPEHPVYTKYLTAGKHLIKLYSRETEAKLKKLYVTNDLDYIVPKPTTTPTPSPTPSNSYSNWLSSKGGKPGLKNNLSALLEIIDGYLGFINLGFSVSLANILYTIDGYLGF